MWAQQIDRRQAIYEDDILSTAKNCVQSLQIAKL